jgi:uncharacterized protein
MPVRSLRSSVLVWPDRVQVMDAARAWAAGMAAERPEVLRIGCFGSYARGDAGVGSDLDLVAIVRHAAVPFVERSATWPAEQLPVPADLLVYTDAEWERFLGTGGRFGETLRREVLWLWPD